MITTASGISTSGIATASGAALKLPPSVRDFQIYRYVKFDCNSTRDAAEEFDISQTRVRQLIARVGEYFIETVPQEEGDDEKEVRLAAAERLAREQLEYLYYRTMKAFDLTQCEDEHGNVRTGKVAYLSMAGRLVLWLSKVPLHAPLEFREDEAENAAEEAANAPATPAELARFYQEVREEAEKARAKTAALQEQARRNVAAESEMIRQEAAAHRLARGAPLGIAGAGRAPHAQPIRETGTPAYDAIPPNAGCSVAAVSRGEMASLAAADDAVSLPDDGTYKSLDEIKAEARRDFLRPAQPLQIEPRETPRRDDLGATGEVDAVFSRPLSRKERRARARQLKRVLAKR